MTPEQPYTPLARRFAGKNVIITGAGSGIGLETARRFAAEGGAVALFEVNPVSLKAAVGRIEADGGTALPFAVDVTVPDQVGPAVEAAAAELGGLDVLVNVAGFGTASRVGEMDDDHFDRMLATNLSSVHVVARRVWPHLVSRGGGVVINTASITGIWSMFGLSAYGAAKAGVISLSRTMAIEGGRLGIRVNSVTPGFVLTPTFQAMIDAAPDPKGFHAVIAGQSALRRMGCPGDVAEAYLYLASDMAAYVTGANLVVDGGVTVGELPTADPDDQKAIG